MSFLYDADMFATENEANDGGWLPVLELAFNADATDGITADISGGTYSKGVYAGEVIRISYQDEEMFEGDSSDDADYANLEVAELTDDLQAAAPWWRWVDEDALIASDEYSELELEDQTLGTEVTFQDGTGNLAIEDEVMRGSSFYLVYKPLGEEFADGSDDDATTMVESCSIGGHPVRQGKAEVVGYVQPFEDSDDEWVCGAVVTLTEDAVAEEVLNF